MESQTLQTGQRMMKISEICRKIKEHMLSGIYDLYIKDKIMFTTLRKDQPDSLTMEGYVKIPPNEVCSFCGGIRKHNVRTPFKTGLSCDCRDGEEKT